MTFLLLLLSAPFFVQIRAVQLRRQQTMIRLKSRHRQTTIERERNTPTDNPITTNHSIQSYISRTHRSASAMIILMHIPFSTTPTTITINTKSNRRARRLDLPLALISVLNRLLSRAMPSRKRSQAPLPIFRYRLTWARSRRTRFD